MTAEEVSNHDERLSAVRRVMRTVARLAAGGPLPVVAEFGTQPIVVALPTDSISDVTERYKRIGGAANVFVAYPDRIVMLSVHELVQIDGSSPHVIDAVPVSPESDVDMLVTWLRSTTTQSGHIRLTAPKHAAPSGPVLRDLNYAF